MNVPCVHTARRLYSGSASDSVHRQSPGQTSCATGHGTLLGFFDAFCVIFRAPPVVPELSASFFELRALTAVSARGLPGVPESLGVLLPGDSAQGLAN